ncbi:MAG: hypothetical protein QXJ13_07970 [Candidatus Bathyarchaeia archaeon]
MVGRYGGAENDGDEGGEGAALIQTGLGEVSADVRELRELLESA